MYTNLTAVAVVIATALYPTDIEDGKLPDARREDILYDTVNRLLFTDEQKAELYARLAEGLEADTGYAASMPIIKRAIWNAMEA